MPHNSPLFGLDWGAMMFSLLALYLIGRRNRFGFLSFIVANVCWVFIGWLSISPAIMIGNAVFIILNLRGYRNWTTAHKLGSETG